MDYGKYLLKNWKISVSFDLECFTWLQPFERSDKERYNSVVETTAEKLISIFMELKNPEAHSTTSFWTVLNVNSTKNNLILCLLIPKKKASSFSCKLTIVRFLIYTTQRDVMKRYPLVFVYRIADDDEIGENLGLFE